MKTSWLKGIKKDAIDELKGNFITSLPMRKRLIELLEDKVQEQFNAQYARDKYGDPNWAYQQADAMGYVRALKEVISLVTHKEIKNPEPRGRGRPRKEETSPKPLI